MQFLDYNENKQRGTYDFPFEFHHLDFQHPQYSMSYHWHVEYEIIRILKGNFLMNLDGKDIPTKADDIIFISGGTLHSGIPEDCVYECIVFDINIFLKQNDNCKKFIQSIIDHSILIYHHFTKENSDIHSIVWNLFDAMQQRNAGYQFITLGEFYHFFGVVYGKHLYLEDAPQTQKDFKRIKQLKHVLELIETSYASPISLEQLSRAANMSPKYFCRFFYEMTHKTPIDYLNYYRIEHACYQLTTTELSTTDIAYSCGFNDLSYFIKTFKKYKSVTPGKYLKTTAANHGE